MCLQQPIPRSKSLYHRFQLSQSPRATLRCCSFPPYSGFDRLYTNENPSRSSLLTEGVHDDNDDYASYQLGSDEYNPSDSLLPPSSPHANTILATAELQACVGSNPSEDVAISVGDLHGESTVFVQAHSIPRVMVQLIILVVEPAFFQKSLGSDEFNPSNSFLPPSSPHANTDFATAEACVGSNPSEDVAISVGDLHGENTVFVQAHSRPRVTPLEWIFFLNSIGLEISSAAVDQVSSPRKPLYAQISLWMAIANVVLCIWELIHGRMKDKDASSNSMVYRSLPDILGWGLAVIQCVWSAVQYYYHHQHASNPIKLSPVALYFIVCLMVLKYKWRG